MDDTEKSAALDLEVLESRMEMESVASLAQLTGDTTPVTICRF